MMDRQEFARRQDHVALGIGIAKQDVARTVEEAIRYGFGVVYVNPCDVQQARALLEGHDIGLGIGVSYPQGFDAPETKVFEGLDAIDNGCGYLDFVINYARLKDGDDDYVRDELTQFIKATRARKPDVVIKVIIECPYLTQAEKRRAAEIVAQSGADYVKLSTGCTVPTSFSLGDVKLLKSVVGDRCKVKASGCVSTVENAVACFEYGADCIGNDWAPLWMEQLDECRWG